MGSPVRLEMDSAVCHARGMSLEINACGFIIFNRLATRLACRSPLSLKPVAGGCMIRAAFSGVSPCLTRMIDKIEFLRLLRNFTEQ